MPSAWEEDKHCAVTHTFTLVCDRVIMLGLGKWVTAVVMWTTAILSNVLKHRRGDRWMKRWVAVCLFFNVGVISFVSARGLVCFLFHCLEGTVPV